MPTDRPNILFFLPDQWRPDFLGFAGTIPVRTPSVDRLAHDGMVYTRATTPSPLCAPARACLASGMSYRRNPVRDNGANFPIDRPTLYARLRDAGYQVGSVGIPLVLRGPAIGRGTSDALVQLQDLAPTFLDAAGAQPLPDADALLLPPAGDGGDREAVLCGLNDWDCVWDGQWKLILSGGSPAALFDHEVDLLESRNLLDAVTGAPIPGETAGPATAALTRLSEVYSGSVGPG